MNKKLIALALMLITGCSSNSTAPLTFSLLEGGYVPYACQEIYQRGTLCTLDIIYENTGKDVFDYDLTARAIDENSRTFAPQNDPTISQITAGGASFINPGETLDWSLEFAVSPGTHLTSVEIFQSGHLIATVPIDLQG